MNNKILVYNRTSYSFKDVFAYLGGDTKLDGKVRVATEDGDHFNTFTIYPL